MKKVNYEKIKNPGELTVICLGSYFVAPIVFPIILALLLFLRPLVIASYYMALGLSVIVQKFCPYFPVIDHAFYGQLMGACKVFEKGMLVLFKRLLQHIVFFPGYLLWWIEKCIRRFTILYDKHQKKKPIISLQMSNQPPVYTNVFRFLGEYFEAFHIPPGIFKMDDFGILHILIRVERPIKDGLEYAEFANILRLRTIHALNNAEEFSAIPSSYWTEDTVFFPDVRGNLLQHRLVVYIATTEEGQEQIQELSAQIKRPANDLNETIK